ncbi:ORF017 [Saltwater crocodilepox virus]|nr:ORF017 [Saltwater crocodilepox virus]
MDALPVELLQEALSFLSDRDLCACRGTCRAWRDAVDAECFWVRRFRARFGFRLALRRGETCRETYQRFPLYRNLVPISCRGFCNIDTQLDLVRLGCHREILARMPSLRIRDECRAGGEVAYYNLTVTLISSAGRRLAYHKESFYTFSGCRVVHEFSGYSCAPRYVTINRFCPSGGSLELRVLPRGPRIGVGPAAAAPDAESDRRCAHGEAPAAVAAAAELGPRRWRRRASRTP